MLLVNPNLLVLSVCFLLFSMDFFCSGTLYNSNVSAKLTQIFVIIFCSFLRRSFNNASVEMWITLSDIRKTV